MIPTILLLAAATNDTTPALGFDLNNLISGGTGASLMAAVIFAGKLILDRTVPSRSDARANVTLVLESLSNMVKVLQEEKLADSERLAKKQERIDLLESASDKDYATIAELRSEILDLRTRLTQKDSHINLLVTELRKIGAVVTGLDSPTTEVQVLEITLPTAETQPETRA